MSLEIDEKLTEQGELVATAAAQNCNPAASDGMTRLGRAGVASLAPFTDGAWISATSITDITTEMATAAYTDIFIDRQLFTAPRKKRPRNR